MQKKKERFNYFFQNQLEKEFSRFFIVLKGFEFVMKTQNNSIIYSFNVFLYEENHLIHSDQTHHALLLNQTN